MRRGGTCLMGQPVHASFEIEQVLEEGNERVHRPSHVRGDSRLPPRHFRTGRDIRRSVRGKERQLPFLPRWCFSACAVLSGRHMMRIRLTVLAIVFSIALVIVVTVVSSAPQIGVASAEVGVAQKPADRVVLSSLSTATPTAYLPFISTPEPGLLIKGYVRLTNGSGLPSARIYRAFASYWGVVVAVTNGDGYYQSDFQYIPGDEMVRVWAELEGYTFELVDKGWPCPEGIYCWRHYYGYEEKIIDFIATPIHLFLPVLLKDDG
jgi:hypothetical protein